MLAKQYNRCAICSKAFVNGIKDIHIDHDHECCPGRQSCGQCVREILCRNCNNGLGHFKENEDILIAAIQYIKKWK